MKNKKIYVTRSSLPPLEEFIPYLKDIWESRWLTNSGKFHQEFEKKLRKFLQVEQVNLFANGTLALITALQALRITEEVITTPYSFVATTHALHWNGIKPVFCDIEEDTMNIDPDKIESLITPKTTAILPVHVYGNPCKVEKIQKIADTYGLKVIYDAAHAFNVKKDGNSILNWGDMSILSFHATKVFNTIEGGAIISNDEKLKKRIDYLKNFGFADETTVVAPGINAKMNELQASLGLLQLDKVKKDIEKRKAIANSYRNKLNKINGISCLQDIENVLHNYSHFPIFVDKNRYGMSRDDLYEKLKENNIYGRRYFYPLISNFSTYKGLDSAHPDNLPIANKIADQVICLPIYPDLDSESIKKIINIIIKYGK
ncbi:MAG: DegT/DnrJ/EryC1/StrS family aminotransferase [Candidatus Marinimicrobia bacterium]|nr:DegT/DnrJ/EryC1/StrS family aminotransferase [Candidatus Neomarinimicrobiota bacterium]